MSQKNIQSLERGLDILFLFTQRKPLLTIEEISSMARLPKSTSYRFASTLMRKGLLESDKSNGKYKLGVRLLRLHSAVLSSLDIRDIALPFMQRLSEISRETVQLVILTKDEGMCIEKVESSETLRVMPDKGHIIGLHSGASGKVIMAYLSPEQQERIIREKGLRKFTPHTIDNPMVLDRELKKIRTQGYAVSQQEIYLGVNAVAAPIFDYLGKVTGSISVAGPRERLTKDKIALLLKPVIEAAQGVSERLGASSVDS
jgi:DNA-binding IclR family transcriptional regulator